MLSATFDVETLNDVKNEFMAENHCWVRAGAVNQVVNTITQKLLKVAHFQKRQTLLKILLERSTNLNQPFEETIYKTEKTVIFIHGRRECDRLSIVLACEGFRVIPVNTHRTLKQRTEAVEKFKKGEYDILVSNDLLARGMNFPNVDHVINYDLPTPENLVQYIHAVGRTGRAGNAGLATSFFDPFGPDSLLARSLIVVKQSMQVVPEFLRDIVRHQQRIAEQCEQYQHSDTYEEIVDDMDFTKDTSECSSSVGKSFSQDSLNARILLKAYRDAESLISITETSSSKSFDNQVDEQEIQKQLKFLNAYLDSSDINLVCQQDKRQFSLQNEIVSITSDSKFEALKTQIMDTESLLVKMNNFEKELSDIRSIIGIEHKMNSLSVDIADKNKSNDEFGDDKENNI
uniref:Helicase C-terminal domain-containing protein n=1 Tax=Meloidogyne javanica TaxID=6303 RepID=A0A915N107_MELJA